MAIIPLFLIIALVAAAWPAYLPHALAYFLIGGLLGAGFRWAAQRHPDRRTASLAPALAIYNLYGWPIALAAMFFTLKPKGKTNG